MAARTVHVTWYLLPAALYTGMSCSGTPVMFGTMDAEVHLASADTCFAVDALLVLAKTVIGLKDTIDSPMAATK